MIEVSGLAKRYGEFEAVRGVSFTVGSGRVVGLLGPNGAGKTTIMKALTGYHRASAGTALLDGKDVALDPVGVKAVVGYLPEGVPLYLDMTVAEYLGFVADARGLSARSGRARRNAAIEKAVVACGLGGVYGVRMERLSKGYRQRVGLAQAILHDPAILILDEPTTGLDPNQILEIRALIRSLGSEKTVILSTHILQEVEALCSEVLILNEGTIVAQGSAAEIAAGMQGEERIECALTNAGPAALESLRSLAGVRSAERAGATASPARFMIIAGPGDGDSVAESVFDWAVGSGAKLVEMRRERMSMEDIFVRLTREDAGK
ncbi:MAG: ATP-binding cassette domain-containing protein [Spirochaetes bacterium]|nr:ATP-binding cassette domain-containing protein [Spirochaetota bacterium]MBU1080558.1 ATP-binding cassette domain-containing protein [Spirochaetota bacterium]